MKTIPEILSAAGWTRTEATAVGSVARVRGTLVVRPRVADIGQAIPLATVLPAGARVIVPGEGEGRVEYSTRSHFTSACRR